MPHAALQEICCCLGQPVAGNPTQYMIEKCFVQAGLDWRYLTLEVGPENLRDAVRGMAALGFRGGNITKPHKIAVIEHLSRLSEAAQLIQAVNCLIRDGDGFLGENTDGKGFLRSLREVEDPSGKRVVILGAGGAARAIAVELALAGASDLTIVNRSPERGEELAQSIARQTQATANYVPWNGEWNVPAEADVVVNATSIGLFEPTARVPVKLSACRPETVVADVVFNPTETRFLAEAKAQGCRALDGLGMLVYQGVIGFKLWTGVDPDVTVMREAVEEFLGE